MRATFLPLLSSSLRRVRLDAVPVQFVGNFLADSIVLLFQRCSLFCMLSIVYSGFAMWDKAVAVFSQISKVIAVVNVFSPVSSFCCMIIFPC